VDRGRPGSKRHLLVDGNGTPLVAVLTGAQVHDSKIFEELVDGVEPVKAQGDGPGSGPKSCTPTKATTTSTAGGFWTAGASRRA
jgi:hypothetical protein